MNKILLFLLIILPIITSCGVGDKSTEIKTVLVSSDDLKVCVEQAEKQYYKSWLESCENNTKITEQKLDTCENIYFPWRGQGISRDQYCRNTTVETIDPSQNYRSCMEVLDPNIKLSIDRCMGGESLNDVQDCDLPDIFIKKLEEDKQSSIDECNSK